MGVLSRLKSLLAPRSTPQGGQIDLDKLKSLWDSTTGVPASMFDPVDIPEDRPGPIKSVEDIAHAVFKQKKMATIVQDDPIDVFPSDELEQTDKS